MKASIKNTSLRSVTMKFSAALLALSAALGMGAAIYAESGDSEENADVNLLQDYFSMNWQGDWLYCDDSSGAIFFSSSDNKNQSAFLETETGDATGFFFRIDAGNGSNNSDTGYCTLSFYDGNGQELFSVSTGIISGLDNYSRFYIGSEDSYFPVPENAEKAVITLNASQTDDESNVNVYFRNPALYLSSDKTLTEAEDMTFMNVTSGLAKVEIGVSSITRWIWIGAVFVVAMVFYFIRMKKQKYKTPKVMKSTDSKL